jgi:hypothetical protein
MAGEAGEAVARARALAVLRVRGAALGAVLVPAALAVVLQAAPATGRLQGAGWDVARWAVTGVALVVLAVAAAVAAVVVRARPAVSPAVAVPEASAPDLHRMVADLAETLEVPAPSAIELTPDCDSWLEDRRPVAGEERRPAPVLVIGSPFLWWMRVAELRALLAPVVAGTGAAADPEIYAARRFVRGLDAAAGVAAQGGRRGPAVLRPAYGVLGRAVRWMLRGCQEHVAEMERAVAAAASERAQAVDYGLRIVAQEQVGLAYAGWDRLLTRVALPAWRMGRWPSRLDAGVVAALSELSRRDRLADGFESRLGQRPACDLLEEPGAVDEAVSLLAARIFHGGPRRTGPDWAPVSWARYPDEVVDRIWRVEAARLVRVVEEAGPGVDAESEVPARPAGPAYGLGGRGVLVGGLTERKSATLGRVIDRLAAGAAEELAVRIASYVEREEARREEAPVCELLPPRTGREVLAEHVTAAVCCAAVDTAGAGAGLDWLDGPALLVDGVRRGDLAWPVVRLVENGDPGPLRAWLSAIGVRADAPLRLPSL